MGHLNDYPKYLKEQYYPFHKIPLLTGEGSMFRCKKSQESFAQFYPVVVKVFGKGYRPEGKSKSYFNQYELLERKLCPDYFCKVISQHWDPNAPPYCQVLKFIPHPILSLLPSLKMNKEQSEFMLARLFYMVWDMQSKNMAHRDIKPGNIMFDAGGMPKLVDLGLWIKLVEEDARVPFAGTPGYVPMDIDYNPRFHDRLSLVTTFLELRFAAYPDIIDDKDFEHHKLSMFADMRECEKARRVKFSKPFTMACAWKSSIGDDLSLWLREHYIHYDINFGEGELELLVMLLKSSKDGDNAMSDIYKKSAFLQQSQFLSNWEKQMMERTVLPTG